MYAKSMLVAMLGASVVNAHMIMTSPVPYGKDTLNNSPLAADGSDFPCKLRSDTYSVTEQNVMVIGEAQPLTFEGSATHGGGSCQISLTTDLTPSKDTDWQVIKSFEGGCPANVDGNLSGGATMVDPYSFNFTIPEGIAAGKYTLAWTWLNRIGNREMYMNCAPVTVKSSSASKRSESVAAKAVEKRSTTFPPMFVANINGCITSENVDIRFPQPGDDVQYLGEPSNLAKVGAAACTGTPTFASAGDSTTGTNSAAGSFGSDSSSETASTSAAVAATTVSTQTSDAAPTSTSVVSVPEVAPSYTSVASMASAASPSPTSSSSTSSSSGALSGSCSVDGEWNCISGTSFQRCASGVWSVSQQMASGTSCTAGLSADLAIVASKRSHVASGLHFRRRSIGDSHHV
ncbi:hypothetical protein N7466_000646 [Penicillium verhagenii]|uniref:uncharacterized protein n=1 Tax=Penicillium verhagenii TaxID=1562060 RepID=UPI0025454EA7|nr:uncharacterized protein N7466_000646 [Penicillium verhagenii]KAJ5947631.1 hypothetical protein N7466_000646 [Penicillium verhagenii]